MSARILLFAAAAAVAIALPACQRSADAPAENKAEAADDGGVDYAAVAQRVVRDSAAVRPGEVVAISGSPVELELLEHLQAAVLLAGGQPIVTINFPRADRRAITEVPVDYLRQAPRAQLAMIQAADVFISAGAVQDPTLFADVPEERFTILRQANQAVAEALAAKRGRSVDIGQTGGIPTEAYAQTQNADPADMRRMFFRALAVGSDQIAPRGVAVTQRMPAGAQVHVRTATGTDVRFRLSGHRSRVSTGRAADNDTGSGMAQTFLPAGDFYACIDPASAEGVVVQPRTNFRGRPVTNLRMTFRQGVLTDVAAEGEGGEALRGYFASLTDAGSKRLSLINIGLNPESRPLEGSHYLSWEMSGVPTLLVGDNRWAGCDNAGQDGFNVHQAGATVTANNAEVVRAGELVTS